ncbi:MAG: PLP-dependent aminotransferase family protein, partial [Alphaproteobacteria bacterium]
MESIRQRIASRLLTPGAKLPSIRAFAGALGVAKSTVVEAYDRLIADGTIASRRGSGFYVSGHMPPLALAEIGPRLDRAIDPLWVSRQSLEASEKMLKPGCGWLPASWMPQEALRRALRSLSRRQHNAYLTDYGQPLGLAPLRQFLSRRLFDQGIDAPPDQILLTDSGTQAIDLLCRFLIEPGDTVFVDDPCYFNFLAMLRAHRARIVGIPFTPLGPDIESFGKNLAEYRPRLYITNSAL